MKIKVNHSLIIAILAILAFPFLTSPTQVSAIEGTCSWHGGVDCAAGRDWDGSAICKDGWKDSSERFYSQEQCKENLHYCSSEVVERLKKKYRLDELYTESSRICSEVSQIPNSHDSFSELREQAIKSIELSARCSAAHDEFMSASDAYDRECYSIGESEYYKRTVDLYTKYLNEQKKYLDEQKKANLKCPINAHAINTTQCDCDAGFMVYGGNECVSPMEYCEKDLGSNSSYNPISGDDIFDTQFRTKMCKCNEGYIIESGKCTLKKTKKISVLAREQADLIRGCENASLDENGKRECIEYQLHEKLYNWEVYNKSAESITKLNQPQTVNTPTPMNQEVKTKEVRVQSQTPTEKEPIKVKRKPEEKIIVKTPKALLATTTATSTIATGTVPKKEGFIGKLLKRLKFW